MTIERIKGLTTAYCDACDEFLENEEGLVYLDFIQHVKNQGWSIQRRHNDWEHFCKECSKHTPNLEQLKSGL